MMMQTEPIMGGSSLSKENVRNACRTVEVKMQPILVKQIDDSPSKEEVQKNAGRWNPFGFFRANIAYTTSRLPG